jgi:hypothetical protein
VRHVETLYGRMHARSVAGLPPEDIAIDAGPPGPAAAAGARA